MTDVVVAKLAKALQVLAKDLPNPADESTDYFRGFSAKLDGATRLTPEAFKAALEIGARYELDLSPADEFLAGAEDPDNWGDDIAHGFRLLETVMRATLSGLFIASARGKGVVRVRIWLFGRADDGTIVGLRSISTET